MNGIGVFFFFFFRVGGRILKAERILIIVIREQLGHVHVCEHMCMYVCKPVFCACFVRVENWYRARHRVMISLWALCSNMPLYFSMVIHNWMNYTILSYFTLETFNKRTQKYYNIKKNTTQRISLYSLIAMLGESGVHAHLLWADEHSVAIFLFPTLCPAMNMLWPETTVINLDMTQPSRIRPDISSGGHHHFMTMAWGHWAPFVLGSNLLKLLIGNDLNQTSRRHNFTTFFTTFFLNQGMPLLYALLILITNNSGL